MRFRFLGGAALVGLLLAPALAPARDEAAFFELYGDWRAKQKADFNLDGYVDYFDALCLSFLWSDQHCRRFYIAGDGAGNTRTVVIPSLDQTDNYRLNTAVAAEPVNVVYEFGGSGGGGGVPLNVAVASEPVELVLEGAQEQEGVPINTTVSPEPIELVREGVRETEGAPTTMVISIPAVVHWATGGKAIPGAPMASTDIPATAAQ